MSWEYSQYSGTLRRDGVVIYVGGYSGAGYAKDRPEMENLANIGPIPRGTWTIGRAYRSRTKGEITMDLTPYGHSAHNRTNFRIHGDSISHPGNASEGCIILPFEMRKLIAESGDHLLSVVR